LNMVYITAPKEKEAKSPLNYAVNVSKGKNERSRVPRLSATFLNKLLGFEGLAYDELYGAYASRFNRNFLENARRINNVIVTAEANISATRTLVEQIEVIAEQNQIHTIDHDKLYRNLLYKEKYIGIEAAELNLEMAYDYIDHEAGTAVERIPLNTLAIINAQTIINAQKQEQATIGNIIEDDTASHSSDETVSKKQRHHKKKPKERRR